MRGLAGVLHQHQAAALFHRFRTDRPIAAATRQHHGKPVAVLLGERAEEQIEAVRFPRGCSNGRAATDESVISSLRSGAIT